MKFLARFFGAGTGDRSTPRRSRGRFLANTSGAVALLFGLTLIPILGFVGGAVDYANAYRTRTKLQNALDAAALAAGRELDSGNSEAGAREAAARVLDANLGDGFPGHSANFQITDGQNGRVVLASGTSNVDTYILGVLGINHLSVNVESMVNISGGNLELSLVLDNSGSMGGSKLTALKDAAKRLTQILFQANRRDEAVKIGVVPFAAAVNVGSGYANAGWMDATGRSSAHFENFTPNATRWSLFSSLRGTSWAGCVEARPGIHMTTDTSPGVADGDSFFVPMFAPDEPDSSNSYNNSYLDDDNGNCGKPPKNETEVQAQMKTCKYNNERPSNNRPGPNYMCDPRPLQPLTDNQGQVISSIENMQAGGLTNIMEGVMWGWRLLSPDEPFTEGRPYNEPDNKKFMIVMTDGANTHSGNSTQNRSRYSAFGYAKNGRLRASTSSTSLLVDAMNDKTSEACNNAKAAGITVYTIAFDLNDPDTLSLLRNCASGSSRAFTIDNGDALISIFEAIAGEINKLRIAS